MAQNSPNIVPESVTVVYINRNLSADKEISSMEVAVSPLPNYLNTISTRCDYIDYPYPMPSNQSALPTSTIWWSSCIVHVTRFCSNALVPFALIRLLFFHPFPGLFGSLLVQDLSFSKVVENPL